MKHKNPFKQSLREQQADFFDYASLNQLRESALKFHFIYFTPVKKLIHRDTDSPLREKLEYYRNLG